MKNSINSIEMKNVRGGRLSDKKTIGTVLSIVSLPAFAVYTASSS
ncbi:hypothetical protein [uncultured Gammaproteobacteria bacterium]|jgi:hypothetical protein|nr:hypothetical protein [uncultured Gammaproteobacteria bacterium]CAC9954399.1 hypothetical protein [uncultured Gammaproteobacteria bacterium]CAC9966903.1 hypothetical protein [uncultured Gammaproteobacteria bacterium]